MQTSPEHDEFAEQPISGSPLRRFFKRIRNDRADQREERDWRRRIILASRRIQQIHIALTDDITEVRSLKEHIEDARPEMERLESVLADARAGVSGLELALQNHSKLVASQVQDAEVVQAAQHSVERVAELELEHAETEATLQRLRAERAEETNRLEERVRSLEAEHATLQAERDAESAELQSAFDKHVSELEAELEDVRAKGAEALREVELEKAMLQTRIDEMAAEHANAVARLEESQRTRDTEGVELFERYETEVDEMKRAFDSESTERNAALESERERRLAAELALERAKLSSNSRILELEAEVAAAIEKAQNANDLTLIEERRRQDWERAAAEFEGRVEEMTKLVAELETGAGSKQGDGETAARILELEGYIQDLERTRAEERARHSQELIDLAQGFESQAPSSNISEAEVAALKDRLRVSEIARLESETRAEREMTDFADHTRERMRRAEGELREKDALIEKLTRENESLQGGAVPNGSASGEAFDANSDRLLDLMRGESAAGRSSELPELPNAVEPRTASDESAPS